MQRSIVSWVEGVNNSRSQGLFLKVSKITIIVDYFSWRFYAVFRKDEDSTSILKMLSLSGPL